MYPWGLMMLRHVVLLRWSPALEPGVAAAVLEELQDLVRTMPGALAANAVSTLGLTDDGYDAALIADFTDADAWRAYQVDPRHQDFVSARLRPLLAGRAVIQVELPDPTLSERG